MGLSNLDVYTGVQVIRRIVLENFMSHRRTVIEPAEGLTVLVGPNNCGKSAVVTALQCLNTCDNRSAPFIRHGQKEARVIVETEEGSRIEWVRGKNFTNYKINGREMTRARRPEDLDEHLRLAEVQSEDGRKVFDLHFAEQKNPIFLLNESGGAAATFFAASSDAAYLVQMQSLLKRRESDTRSRKRDLESRIDRQRRQMEVFNRLPDIEQDVRRAQEAYNTLSVATDEGKALRDAMYALTEASLDREACRADLSALNELSVPPEIPETSGLSSIVDSLSVMARREGMERERVEAMTVLFAPPDMTDTSPLSEAITSIATKDRRNRRLAEKLAISEEAPPPPAMEDPAPLRSLVALLEARSSDVSRAQTLADATLQELAEAREAVIAYVADHPTCPVCGSLVQAEKLLA